MALALWSASLKNIAICMTRIFCPMNVYMEISAVLLCSTVSRNVLTREAASLQYERAAE